MTRGYVQVHVFALVVQLGHADGLDGALQAFQRNVHRADVLGEQLEFALVELYLDRAVQDVFLERVLGGEVDLHVEVPAGVVLGERGVRRASLRRSGLTPGRRSTSGRRPGALLRRLGSSGSSGSCCRGSCC